MGFFKKVFKSVGKVFKKIGKGIKSAFKKFGKFMGKIGILGQIAMMFILPGIGNAILGTAGTAATVAGVGGATVTAAAVPASGLLGGALGSVGVAAGKAVQFVGKALGKVGNTFSNITKGVTETLGNFAKTATNKLANKIGMDNVFSDAASNFFGPGDSAFSRSFGETSRFQNLTQSQDFFSKQKEDIVTNLDATTEYSGPLDAKDVSSGFEEYAVDGTIPQVPASESPSILGSTDGTSVTAKSEPGLMSRVGTSIVEGVKGIPEKTVAAVEEFAADPTGKLFEGFESNLQSSTQNRVLQEVGLQAKPEYNVQNISNVAFVPSFDSFGGSQQEYGAQEIMSPRSFEQNVLNNPNPYGYTAFQYGQFMSQLG